MRSVFFTRFVSILFAGLSATAAALLGAEMPCLNPDHPDRQPISFNGRLIPPDIGCFWRGTGPAAEIKAFADHVGKDGAFDAFCLTVRGLESFSDNPQNEDDVRQGVEYAFSQYGIGAHLDIDLRIARLDFERKYPNRLQEQLFLEEKEAGAPLEFVMKANDLNDHYTGVAPYYVRGARFLKAWRYRKTEKGEVIAESVREISSAAQYKKVNEKECRVSFAKEAADSGEFIAIAVAFAYRYPDLFSKEALECDAELYKKYSAVPALGSGKDEFGMLPAFMYGVDLRNAHWYSETMRECYARRSDGRDLIDDCFLMFIPQTDRESDRAKACDIYRRMTFDRMLEYESQNYDLTKECWGKTAFVGVHGTWFPWPNINEFRKNGLFWWKMKRDFAQSDEYTPFCCRNGMAKGTDSCWINMYYAATPKPYLYEHWTAALSAGRVHIHQLYPSQPDAPKEKMLSIVDAGAGRIRTAVRLLNYITGSPIESPAAVIFGHFGAMNPARPEYKKVGVFLCDHFAENGYPADLIPSDEINTMGLDGKKRWQLNADGHLQYGSQPYRYLVFYGDGESDHADFEAIEKLAGENCKTNIVRIPAESSKEDSLARLDQVIESLRNSKIPGHTPWERDHYQFISNSDEVSVRPKMRGTARLIDETIVWVSGENCSAGDPIELNNETVVSNDGTRTNRVSMKCTGIGACRFDDKGAFEALAAAELTYFKADDIQIELQTPTDIVLWRDNSGWHGIFQTKTNELPEVLKKITSDWKWLKRNF